LVSIKTFALTEAVLGLLVLLYPFVWCYASGDAAYLFYVEVAFGVIILVVAALALMTKSPHAK
jgi:hypothetical protein